MIAPTIRFFIPALLKSTQKISIFLLITMGSCSCSTWDLPKLSPDIAKRADQLDAAQQQLELYGTATVSAPILVNSDNEIFEFKLDRGADSYFSEAKSEVQGAISTSTQKYQNTALSIAVAQDPDALKKYQELLKQYDSDLARQRVRDRIEDDAAAKIMAAAEEQYTAEIDAAVKSEPDPIKRGPLISDATKRLDDARKLTALTEPQYPNSTTPSLPTATPKEGEASKTFSSEKFSNALQLVKDMPGAGTRTISNRSAIVTAAGDKTVESIFRVLSNPEKTRRFDNKKVFFGVSMVSVIPGRRTRQDFSADVSVEVGMEMRRASPERTASFLNANKDIGNNLAAKLTSNMGVDIQRIEKKEYQESYKNLNLQKGHESDDEYGALSPSIRGGDLSKPDQIGLSLSSNGEEDVYLVHERFSPTVAAVAPMTETQILDLASSVREQKEFALSLSYALQSAGLNAQASAFNDYAKRIESDAITRTPQNLVTGYSRGNVFGYQVGPSFQAIEDVSSKTSQGGEKLQRQSFPVLVIFGADSNLGNARVYKKANGEYILLEPYLALTQQNSWAPIHWVRPWRRASESDRARVAAAIYQAQQDNIDCDPKIYGGCTAAQKYLNNKSRQLNTLIGVSKMLIAIPSIDEKSPKIKSNYPVSIPALIPGATTEITFLGKDLDAIDTKTISVPLPANGISVTGVQMQDGALKISILAKRAITAESLVFSFEVRNKQGSIASFPSLPIPIN